MNVSAAAVTARAPGRVNLIGEHTDYTGGFVLPCAIGYETRVTARARGDRTVTVRSSDAATGREAATAFDLDRLPDEPSGDWQDYVRGVLCELRAADVALAGADLAVTATLPRNAGLSSSASFEAALALALLELAGASLDRRALALLLQRAESAYTGTACGIMDQFAVLHARAGSLVFLDTRDLTFERVAFPASLAIVVCDSGVGHDLSADGAYTRRRRECEAGVEILRSRLPSIRDLRDVTPAQVTALRGALPAPLFERCLHVTGENARVTGAVAALRAGDAERLGALMYESHESLRTNYEVSCPELDTLVALARDLPGVYGARMTGGGFGGCTVNVVRREDADDFKARIAPAYERATGIAPACYDGTPAAGASVSRA